MINDDKKNVFFQRSLLGWKQQCMRHLEFEGLPAGLQPTHNHLLDVCFKVSSFKELIKMTVLQCTMMAPAAAMPDKTGMEDWTSSLGLTSQHVSATFYLSQLPGCSMLFYWVRWTDSSSYLELSWAVLVVALRSDCYFICGTHHHYIHRFIAHGAASQDLARHHAWLKKGSGHLRTIQDVWFLIFKVIPSHSMFFCHYSDGNPRSPSRKECTPVTALDVLRPHAQESCMERLNLSWNLQPK